MVVVPCFAERPPAQAPEKGQGRGRHDIWAVGREEPANTGKWWPTPPYQLPPCPGTAPPPARRGGRPGAGMGPAGSRGWEAAAVGTEKGEKGREKVGTTPQNRIEPILGWVW